MHGWVGSRCATAGLSRPLATAGSKKEASALEAFGGIRSYKIERKNKYVKLDKNAQQPLG